MDNVFVLINKMKEKGRHIYPQFTDWNSYNNFDFFDDGVRIYFNFDDFENNFQKGYLKMIKGLLKVNDFQENDLEKISREIYSSNPEHSNYFLSFEPLKTQSKIFERKKEILENIEKEIAPVIEPLVEDYFNKKFVKDYLEGYILLKFQHYAGSLIQNLKISNKHFVNLSFNCDKNFIDGKLSGYGISTLVHELSHLYQYSFSDNRFINLDEDIREAHANISMYEILDNSSIFGDNKKELNFERDKFLNQDNNHGYWYKFFDNLGGNKNREKFILEKSNS
jgi:hypothetical protein